MTRVFVTKTQSASFIAITCLAVALFAIPGSAQSATLYVATNGNDLNPGTLSAPFRTISQAASVASPGAEVIVRGGTYRQVVYIGNSGTASAYIRFHPYRGETAIIDGQGSPTNTDLVVIGGNYVEFRNFEIRNATGAGVVAWNAQNVNIICNIIHDGAHGAIWIGAASSGISHDNIVENNIVYHNVLFNRSRTPGTLWDPAITSDTSDNTQITGNTVYQNYGEGIDALSSNGVMILNNYVFDNFSMEIYLDNSPNTTVKGNFAYSTGNSQYFTNDGKPAVAIGMAIEPTGLQLPLSGNTITNNTMVGGVYGFYYGNYGQGGGMQNTLIANNTIANQTDGAIHIDPDSGHSANRIAYNILYRSPAGTLQSGSAVGFTFGNNCWFGGIPGPFA